MSNNLACAVQDCLVLSGRGARHLVRRLDTLVTAAILPIVILLLFDFLFGGAMSIAMGGGNYLNYVLPGILLMSIGYVATTTATSVNDDMTKGFVSRLKSMPVARPAFIIGHLFSSLVRNLVAMACVIGLAFALGYRSGASPMAWLGAVGIMLAFALAMTSIAIVLGLLASGPDAASAYSMPLMFLAYFTGAFVPLNTMPKLIRAFCTHQPINIVLQAVSGLLSGSTPVHAGAALAWCAGVTIACLAAGGILFARKGAATPAS